MWLAIYTFNNKIAVLCHVLVKMIISLIAINDNNHYKISSSYSALMNGA